MTQAELMTYWLSTAREDWETAIALIDLKRFSQGLFFVHLALEKYLKALIIKGGNTVPFDHNLIALVKLARIDLDPDELSHLTEINTFHIRARYDDYKRSFYTKATEKYTREYLGYAHKFQSTWETLCQKTS